MDTGKRQPAASVHLTGSIRTILIRILMLLAGVSVSWMIAAGPAFADIIPEELEALNHSRLYVLLPPDYDQEQKYPSVYFMPIDGMDARLFFGDGTLDRILELEEAGKIPGMICVFPQFDAEEEVFGQAQAAIRAVEEKYPAVPDASMRGVIGTGVGGYLAFLLGYGAKEGEIEEAPIMFSAIASHCGDFTSGQNPYLSRYGDICSILEGPVGSFGADTRWLKAYHTYLDCVSESDLTWARGGSADIASLYRYGGLSDSSSLPAWDYSVFEYSILPEDHYGAWQDHIEHSLLGFAAAFGMTDVTQETESVLPYPAKESDPVRMDGSEGRSSFDGGTGIQTDAVRNNRSLTEEEKVTAGPDRRIDLMGDWYFTTVDALRESDPGIDGNDIDKIVGTDWKSWDVVLPGQDWWTEDFASSLKNNPYYVGYAWYVREFEIPEDFDVTGLQIETGRVDEADEVYVNQVRVGQTGIPDEGGSYDGTNPWEEERVYPLPDDLLHAGTNVVCVRVCNSSGMGGWYAGPILISAIQEIGAPKESEDRFYTASFASDSLLGQKIEYRVYLPEGYYESESRYPVIYMLHGYGSTGKSFEISGVPGVLDEGIASGEIPPCIVIFPSDGHPQKASWWSAAYADMLNEDLVRQVDSTLRTVDSREYRFLAGESMGGGGAYLNALDHPELYGGVLDLYGALRYTGSLGTFLEMDAEQLGEFRHYIICGNHDMYCFDIDHIQMGKHLYELKVPNVFEIDNGEHSSSFYLPRLKEGFAYLLSGLAPLE